MKKMLNEEELKLKRAIQNIDIVPRELCFSNSISKYNLFLLLLLLKEFVFMTSTGSFVPNRYLSPSQCWFHLSSGDLKCLN